MTTKISPQKFIAAVIGIVALFAFPLVSGNPYYIHLVETILIYAIVLFGLDIVVGYTGQVSLGHAGLFGIGSYVTAVLIMHFGTPWFLAVPASIVVTALFGAILAVDEFTLEKRLLRASFGTTKYCSFFLKGQKCINKECLYLHKFNPENETFTKEQMAR